MTSLLADPPGRAFAAAQPLATQALLRAPLRSLPRPSRLTTPLTTLPGVGERSAALVAARLGVADLGGLLAQVPHDYRDLTAPRSPGSLQIGDHFSVQVEVVTTALRRGFGRHPSILEARVRDPAGDGSEVFVVSWFNQPWLRERLRPGVRLSLDLKREDERLVVRRYELVGRGGKLGWIHTAGMVPLHPGVEGVRVERLREWVFRALDRVGDSVETLPAGLRARRRLAGRADALKAVHFPTTPAALAAARRRLAYEELFLYQLALAWRRRRRATARTAIALGRSGPRLAAWTAALPFAPTADQVAAFATLDRDLAAAEPMQRLLMGEVGSGKTVVALYAMLRAVESGHQAALMAPTETLAEQHAATIEALLGPIASRCALLRGSTPAARRREVLAALESGEIGIIVGTHALIEDEVRFASLAVAVVDEQHRFGVRQRAALDAKSAHAPHLLHMTATPIPRTLALTAYGDLETISLRGLPAGRHEVKTRVVGEQQRPDAYEYVREQLRAGRQGFVVCPLVSESEKLEGKAVAAEAARLGGEEFSDFEVVVLHGQMRSAEKSAAMARFAGGEADLLVATSVIEVGIDVPNATVMIIESADRYGLSQLHQLRGRVGRGGHPGTCILFASPSSERARRRLAAIASERDGFALAEIDLKLRGEGDLLGTKQSGLPEFSVAELPEDLELLLLARADVGAFLAALAPVPGRLPDEDDPELVICLEAARRRFDDERAERVAA